MGDIYLATGSSNGIKLWNTEGSGLTLFDKFVFNNESTPSLCWSADNQFLANSFKSSKQISVRRLSIGDEINLSSEECVEKSHISFDSSNNLYAGGKDGIVHTWDIRDRKIKHSYKNVHSAVSSIQVKYSDSTLAVGYENGIIMIYKRSINYLLPVKSRSAVSCLRFHNFESNMLAAASMEGLVSIYDVKQKELNHKYENQHVSPVTAVAFSPLNNKFMLSAGLDKKIICYDLLKKIHIKSIICDDPITSLDMHHNGHTVAIGTTTGRIILYDLRRGSTPTLNTLAHEPPVFCLKFENKRTMSQRSKAKVEFVQDKIDESAPPNDNQSDVDKCASASKDASTDLFSPFRAEGRQVSTKSSSSQLPSANVPNEATNLAASNILVFSPVGGGAPGVKSERNTPKSIGPKSQPLLNYKDQNEEGASLSHEPVTDNHMRIVLDPNESSVRESEGSCGDANMNASERYYSDDNENQTGATGIMNSSINSFPVELLRKLVRSEVEDCFEQLHRGFLNLHLEIVKKFHEQQVQLQQAINSANREPHLLNEIKRLKEENDRLKSHFK